MAAQGAGAGLIRGVYQPLSGKARVICVHPRMPICACSDGDKVALWEFKRARHAEKPTGHTNDVVTGAGGGLGNSDEPIHALEFLDYETLSHAGYGPAALRGNAAQADDTGERQSMIASQNELAADGTTTSAATSTHRDRASSSAEASATSDAHALSATLRGRRYLIVLRESRVRLLELVSGKHMDAVSKQHLDGRAPTAIAGAFAGGSATLLIGCMDGAVRVLQVDRWQVVLRLTGAHRGAVTCITHVPDDDEGVLLSSTHPMPVSGGADGSIAVWDAHFSSSTATRVISRAHDGTSDICCRRICDCTCTLTYIVQIPTRNRNAITIESTSSSRASRAYVCVCMYVSLGRRRSHVLCFGFCFLHSCMSYMYTVLNQAVWKPSRSYPV